MNDQVLDWLYGVLVSPVETFRTVAREKPVGAAVLLIFSVTVLQAAATSPLGASAMQAFEIELSRAWIITGSSALSFFGSLIGILIVYGTSALFRPSGDLAGTLSAIGFSQFPTLFGIPASLLSRTPGVGFLGGLISFGVGIWTLALAVMALRESRGLSTGKSILSYVIAGIVLVLVVGLLIVAAVLLTSVL